ncbi:MAG: hypothetical protein ACOC1F_07365 [Myxococcota bacterium]
MDRAALLTAVLGWMTAAGCSGTDHDALAARDASTGGSGGSIVDAGGSESDSGSADAPPDVVADAPPPDSSFVADGPSVFTFVNGIPNARAVRICFEVETSSGFESLPMVPVPDALTGLAYGRAYTATSIPGADLDAQSVRPVVFTGELQYIDGKSCDELEVLPEGVGSARLQAVPTGTLARGRSVLMVAAGCVAGSDDEASVLEAVCGLGYMPSEGNASLLMASMERTSVGAMGLQVFSAAKAAGKLTVEHVTAFPSMATTLVHNIAVGQMAPRPPTDALPVGNLGTSAEENSVRVFADNAAEPVAEELLTEALERGGLTLDALQDGKNYTVVMVGPKPAVGEGAWFRPFTVTVLPSDP